MPRLHQKSDKILRDNIMWLLSSDIRIKNGKNKGALYGWKNLDPISFPFIYSEITGYAVTCFSWIASEFANPDALKAAEDAYNWILRGMNSYLLYARPPAKGMKPNKLSKMFYSFDNSMILIGILNLYKITRRTSLLQVAEKMAKVLIKRFFDGEKMIARLNHSYKSIKPSEEEGIIKWSTVPGAYHCKLSLGLLELSSLMKNEQYADVSDSLCDYAIKLQKSNGQFLTNPRADITYLHPHLYACEGLIHSGIKQSNRIHYKAGLKGLLWSIEHIDLEGKGGLFRDTAKRSVEQSDCTAQLLRLMILCHSELKKSINKSDFNKIIESLHSRLLDFYIPEGEAKGGMRYQLEKDAACSWCTMFSIQASWLWNSKDSDLTWIDYFI